MSVLTPFRVGLLVLVGTAAFFWYAQTVAHVGLDEDDSYTIFAQFKDATGLAEKGLVRIAGVVVGQIEDIALERGRAKVTMRIRRDIEMFEDGAVTKRFESILGDAVIELRQGTPRATKLSDGAEVRKVVEVGGVDTILQELEFTARNVRQLTDTLSRVMTTGEGSFLSIIESVDKIAGQAESIMARLEKTVDRATMTAERTASNMETISAELVNLTDKSSVAFERLVADTEFMVSQLRDMLQTVKRIVDTSEGEVANTTESVRQTMAEVHASMAAIRRVTESIDRGEGSIGRLVKDDTLITKVESSLDDVSTLLGSLSRLQTRIDVRSEMQLFPGGRTANKNVIGIELAPRKDKYYLIELVDDPRGNTTVVREQEVVNGQVIERTRTRTTGAFKISAQFAKRYYWVTLRLGLMENTGGLGFDMHFLDDSLKVRTDLFDVTTTALPRLRTQVSYTFMKFLYLSAGIDDALNDNSAHPFGRAGIFSAGLRFTDDDLRSLLTVVPLP